MENETLTRKEPIISKTQKYTWGISVVAILLSIISLVLMCRHSEPYTADWGGVLVGVLGILVTVLCVLIVINYVTFEDKMRKIVDERLEHESKITKQEMNDKMKEKQKDLLAITMEDSYRIYLANYKTLLENKEYGDFLMSSRHAIQNSCRIDAKDKVDYIVERIEKFVMSNSEVLDEGRKVGLTKKRWNRLYSVLKKIEYPSKAVRKLMSEIEDNNLLLKEDIKPTTAD